MGGSGGGRRRTREMVVVRRRRAEGVITSGPGRHRDVAFDMPLEGGVQGRPVEGRV